MDDLYPFFHDHTDVIAKAVAAEIEAQRMLAAAVAAETKAQRMLAAMKYVQFPRRLELLFRPRRGPAPNLPQGLGPSSPSVTQKPAATMPHALRRRGRPRGSYAPQVRALEAGFPEWYEEVRRLKGRAPTLIEAAKHWDINRRTVVRTLKRLCWSQQYPMYKKKPKRL
jgi:hypothetical protein